MFRRSDVATREVVGGKDLGDVLARAGDGEARTKALGATAELLRALERAGARHPDLNVTNVLIVATDGLPPRALVLDVDRVVFGERGDVRIGAANVRRLLRSARKLRANGRITISDEELSRLAADAGHHA
jgi:predicted Ser/Thr protein kinase